MEVTATIYDKIALVKVKGELTPHNIPPLFDDLQELSTDYLYIVVSVQEGKPPPAFVDGMKALRIKVKARSHLAWASRHHPGADGIDRVDALMKFRNSEATRVADVLRLTADVSKIRKEREELLLKRESILRKSLGSSKVESPSSPEEVAALEAEFRLELDGKRQLFSMLSKGMEISADAPAAKNSPSNPSEASHALTTLRRSIMRRLGNLKPL